VLQCLERVSVRNFAWSKYPEHFQLPHQSYAWKPTLILDALQHGATAVFYQDAGQELRARLDAVLDSVLSDGYIFVANGFDFPEPMWTHSSAFAYFNMSSQTAKARGRPEVAGGIIGFSASSTARRAVLEPWVACCKIRRCITPDGSSRANHRQDQSALNLIIASIGWQPKVHLDEGMWAYYESTDPKQQITANETEPAPNGVVLFSRRGNQPKPYMKHARFKAAGTCYRVSERLGAV